VAVDEAHDVLRAGPISAAKYALAARSTSFTRLSSAFSRRSRWRTRLELANAIFEYLEIFHNRQRRHSALGMLTPIEYELHAAPVA
jgi:putative transposase